jgi:hypothetical protein
MGKKIFVSYKYADSNVAQLPGHSWYNPTTVRDYVDALERYFDNTNHIYKGESDDEDLSMYSEDTIWEKLKDRIYDSSVTIVMISPNMRENNRRDRSQWIPWEVSFSLKETTRNDRTSHTNAMLAIVLPDSNGSYDYYLTQTSCGSTNHHTDRLFKIIRENKFNKLDANKEVCPQCGCYHYYGECSYIEAVKWSDFISLPNHYINKAVRRQENIDSFEITKEV